MLLPLAIWYNLAICPTMARSHRQQSPPMATVKTKTMGMAKAQAKAFQAQTKCRLAQMFGLCLVVRE